MVRLPPSPRTRFGSFGSAGGNWSSPRTSLGSVGSGNSAGTGRSRSVPRFRLDGGDTDNADGVDGVDDVYGAAVGRQRSSLRPRSHQSPTLPTSGHVRSMRSSWERGGRGGPGGPPGSNNTNGYSDGIFRSKNRLGGGRNGRDGMSEASRRTNAENEGNRLGSKPYWAADTAGSKNRNNSNNGTSSSNNGNRDQLRALSTKSDSLVRKWQFPSSPKSFKTTLQPSSSPSISLAGSSLSSSPGVKKPAPPSPSSPSSNPSKGRRSSPLTSIHRIKGVRPSPIKIPSPRQRLMSIPSPRKKLTSMLSPSNRRFVPNKGSPTWLSLQKKRRERSNELEEVANRSDTTQESSPTSIGSGNDFGKATIHGEPLHQRQDPRSSMTDDDSSYGDKGGKLTIEPAKATVAGVPRADSYSDIDHRTTVKDQMATIEPSSSNVSEYRSMRTNSNGNEDGSQNISSKNKIPSLTGSSNKNNNVGGDVGDEKNGEGGESILPSNSNISEISGPSTMTANATPKSTNSSQKRSNPTPPPGQSRGTAAPPKPPMTPPKSLAFSTPTAPVPSMGPYAPRPWTAPPKGRAEPQHSDRPILTAVSSESESSAATKSSACSTLGWRLANSEGDFSVLSDSDRDLPAASAFAALGSLGREARPPREGADRADPRSRYCNIAASSSGESSATSSLIYSLGDTATVKSAASTVKSYEASTTELTDALRHGVPADAQRAGGNPGAEPGGESGSLPESSDDGTDGTSSAGVEGGGDMVDDLVASTLEECRLLLELSPPPTSEGGGFRFNDTADVSAPQIKSSPPRAMDSETPLHSNSKQQDAKERSPNSTAMVVHNQGSGPLLSPQWELPSHSIAHHQRVKLEPKQSQKLLAIEEDPRDENSRSLDSGVNRSQNLLAIKEVSQPRKSRSADGSVNSDSNSRNASYSVNSNSNSKYNGHCNSQVSVTSISSITKFLLSCPACGNEFSEEREECQPLHSFACDHIVCRGCVQARRLRSPTSASIACPACSMAGAFDARRPVVSRAYLSLIRRVREESLAAAPPPHGLVPAQISVPSPKAAAEDHGENASQASSKVSAMSFMTRRSDLPALTVDTGDCTPVVATASDGGRPPRGEDDVDGISKAESTEEEDGSPPARRPDPSSEPPRVPVTPRTPTTPASLAEYMFQQRKEKLARSLDRVNRILERSRLTRGATTRFGALKEEEEAIDGSVREADGPAVSGGGNPGRARKADSGVVEEDSADDSDKKEAASPVSVENLMAKLRVDKKHDEEESLANDKSVKSRLKKDLRVDTGGEGDRDMRQSQGEKDMSCDESSNDGSAVCHPKTELGVDTGEAFLSSLVLRESGTMQRSDLQQPQERKKKHVVSKDTKAGDARLPAIDSINTDPAAENDLADIFRTFDNKPQEGVVDANPPLIEFGTHMIAQSSLSSDSSLAGEKDDTLFLLKPSFDLASTDSKENDGRLAQLRRGKFRDYKIKEGRARSQSSSEKPRRQRSGGRLPQGSKSPQREQCPQFLPSLNYSTLHESDEFSGLFPQNDGDLSPTWGAGRGTTNLVQRMRKPLRTPLASIGGDAFTPFSQSFDESAAVAEKEQGCWDSGFDLDCQRGPTYDFCAPSCSMSENDDDEPLNGPSKAGRVERNKGRTLVTHRTRGFHKKLLNRFRGIKKGRKSTL